MCFNINLYDLLYSLLDIIDLDYKLIFLILMDVVSEGYFF